MSGFITRKGFVLSKGYVRSGPSRPGPLLSVTLDSEVSDWVARVIANSGTVSNATTTLVNTFMVGIKAAGIRSKILRCNLFCGDQVAAAKTPLIKDKGAAYDTDLVGGGSGWTYVETGAGGGLNRNLGAGSSRALDTGFIPANDLAADNDAHLSVYVVTGSTESTWACGVQDALANDWGLVGPSYTAVGTRLDCWKPGTPNNIIPNSNGYFIGNRVSADAALYLNGGLLQNSVAPGGNRVVTYKMVFFGVNLTGTELGPQRSTKTQAGYTLGTGLTTQNITDLNTYMQNFQSGLSRNV